MRYTKIIDDCMSFGEAMEKLLDGKKISRLAWGGYWQIQDTEFGMAIVAELKDGGRAVATPYQEDMLAFDWQVVE